MECVIALIFHVHVHNSLVESTARLLFLAVNYYLILAQIIDELNSYQGTRLDNTKIEEISSLLVSNTTAVTQEVTDKIFAIGVEQVSQVTNNTISMDFTILKIADLSIQSQIKQ